MLAHNIPNTSEGFFGLGEFLLSIHASQARINSPALSKCQPFVGVFGQETVEVAVEGLVGAFVQFSVFDFDLFFEYCGDSVGGSCDVDAGGVAGCDADFYGGWFLLDFDFV